MKHLFPRQTLLIAMLTALLFPGLHALTENRTFAVSKHPTCEMCHVTAEIPVGTSLFPEGTDPASICLRCHDYRENHHPVDFVPAASHFTSVAKTFPLYDNKIRCLTCHDPHAGPKLSEAPNFLRGGPYRDRREICFKCHQKDAYAEISPHVMKDEEGIIQLNGKPICLVCHTVTPDPAVDRTTDVKFRADVAFLCWRCHPPMPGEFFTYHFLVKPSRRTLSVMKKSEQTMNVIFPLVPRGRITCSTCHNPHQKEVLVHEPAKTGAESRYKLRVESPAACVACHPTK
jgi:predicted CXXCH cytochrome family protein